MRIILLGGFALLLHAQQEPQDLLTRVRAKIAGTINRLTNYMCTETVERAQYELDGAGDGARSCGDLLAHRGTAPQTVSDRLRLDVGVGANGEIYSWAGENHFHDRSLSQFVTEGAISNGSFASFLTMIFTGDQAEFSYDGEKIDGGRRLAQFAFRVSLQTSHYTFFSRIRVITAYEGTFLVDPNTFDLVRLVIRTKGLPLETGACEATTTLDYRRVRLNDAEFLLPAATRLQIVDTDGSERDNHTVFSDCREFRGESVVTYGAPAETASSTTQVSVAPALALPQGLPFEIALTQNIDTATAAAGDRIAARLDTPIRDHSFRIWAPAGTPVTGRILEVRRLYRPPPVVEIRIRLESLTIGGTSQPFAAAVRSSGQRYPSTPAFGGIWLRGDRGTATMVLSDPKHHLVIKRGLKLSWLTDDPSKREP